MSRISLYDVKRDMRHYMSLGFEPYALAKLLRINGGAITCILNNKSINKKNKFAYDIAKVQDFFLQAREKGF